MLILLICDPESFPLACDSFGITTLCNNVCNGKLTLGYREKIGRKITDARARIFNIDDHPPAQAVVKRLSLLERSGRFCLRHGFRSFLVCCKTFMYLY